MPQAAIPIAAEAAVASTMTAAEIAAAQAAAAELAAAQAAAAQAVAATNSSVLSTIAATPVSSAAGATAAGAGTGAGGAGGISSLVNTTGGPTTWEQIFSQGQNLAEGSTELGKLASTASELPALPEAITGPAIPSSAGPVTAPIPSAAPPAPQIPTLPAAPPAPPAIPPIEPPPVPPSPDAATQISRLQSMGAEAPLEPASYLKSTTPFQYPSVPTVPAGPATIGLGGAPAGTVLGSGSGIQALANEVGATSAFNTAPTLTQYGAGAPTSTLPTTFNPAAPMANPTYAQPSGLQGLQTNLSGSLGSNLPPPSVTQAVTSAGTGAPPETDILKQMINPNGAERFAGTQNLIENPASVPSDMYTKESLRVPLDEQLGRMPTEAIPNTTIPAQAATPASDAMSGIKGLWKDFTGMSLKDKALIGMMASSAYDMLNRPNPYEKPKYKSTWNGSNYTGYQPVQPTPYRPNYAHGGLADLGGYSDGGRMLKGPGDGMSDDIPATIANKQPARLANEEFVIPADVVSHLGNGSSEAGAKQLYKMMDRVRKARTGNKKQGKQINPEKYLA